MAKVQQLIEDTNLDCEFSEEEVLFYAQQIGIDVKNEQNLLWIAKEGLSANVPTPWLIFSDELERIFYYNPKTHEASWCHPLDKEYVSLVSEERTRSLNSASTDYGFESKLSSLADAPPLSSSGKNTPTSGRLGKPDGNLSSCKIEFGRIQNRRGTQLAPVRLNALKMPTPSEPKSGSGFSFMPKGSTLTKNVKRAKEESDYSHQPDRLNEERHRYEPAQDESNESLNSDEGSKYSYEDSEEDDKEGHELEPYDLLDTSQLSPMRSVSGSPSALEISSLVQLSTRLPGKKTEKKENLINKENSPSLNLRKVGQPSFLKPMTQTTKKKGSFKGCQNIYPLDNSFKDSKKKLGKAEINEEKYGRDSEMDTENKISIINNEQKLMLDEVQKEWLAMQDELEKQEKEKYHEMVKGSSKKLEEEEKKMRNENSEALLNIQNELKAKIVEEEKAAEEHINEIKETNKTKIQEEQKRLQAVLENLTQSLKSEIKKMEEKKSEELALKQKELDQAHSTEIAKMKQSYDSKKKLMEEDQLAEIAKLQESHKQKANEIKSQLDNEKNYSNKETKGEELSNNECQEKYQNLLKLIEDETKKYKILLNEKDNLSKEITAAKSNQEKIKVQLSEAQTSMQELQEEVDKTENDLDLLKSEKSALISELNILKENIKNEKTNLLNLEKVKSKFEVKCNKEFSETGVNTQSKTIDTACKSSQAFVSCTEAICQVERRLFVSESSSQTFSQIYENNSCQVELLNFEKEKVKHIVAKENIETNKIADENAKTLSGWHTMLDSRISIIEQQLRFLQDQLSKSSHSSPEPAKQQFSDTSKLNINAANVQPVTTNSNPVPACSFSTDSSSTSHVKCKCELGDATSCAVMQDVKSSMYQMNDILNHHYIPPFRSQSVYQINPLMPDYSSPFENFYAQVRELQEKQRLAELKQRCESEFVKFTRSSSLNSSDHSANRNFVDKQVTNPSYSAVQSNLYSYNGYGDPIHRARNLVLREQAKAWKEQQSFGSSVPHILSSNITSALTSSSLLGITSPFSGMPPNQQPFFQFEIDPETDYSNWMTKLNALQHRIRSHKML